MKGIYLARRAKTISRDEWPDVWRTHARFATQFPVTTENLALIAYYNRIDQPALEGTPVQVPGLCADHDGVAILANDAISQFVIEGYPEEDFAKILQDEERVFDMLTFNFTWDCEVTLDQGSGGGEVVVFRFLKPAPGISAGQFGKAWDEIDDSFAKAQRHVHNRLSPDRPLFPFAGVSESWFASEDDAVQGLLTENDTIDGRLSTLSEADQNVTILARVCNVWTPE